MKKSEAEFHWRDSIIYQIYPKSFQDSNGDGIGDLPGIISRLDYLNDGTDQSLGVSAIWISPFYPSPMADGGYDISDYCAVDQQFGTLSDFDRLVHEAHRRDIKIIIDYIPNHTSDQHSWFLTSRSDKESKKRDWYVWRDPKPDGSPPNNWLSVFGGSAWEFDVQTGQYYLHSFAKEQPDLNWENAAMKQAMFAVVRFWLDRGVDGIRVDAFNQVFKDYAFLDEPVNQAYVSGKDDPYNALLHVYAKDVAGKLPILKELCDVVDEYDHKFIVTEAYLELDDLLYYYKVGEKETLSPFNFWMIRKPWDAQIYKDFLAAYEKGRREHDIGNFVLSNHDNPRIATRVGHDAARAAAVLLFTLRGVPFIYYGDELGMHNGTIPPDRVQDPKELINPGKGLGRDPARTPMQWNSTSFAGFSTTEPWLPVNSDYHSVNMVAEQAEQNSFLSLYKHLIQLRKDSVALRRGVYIGLDLSQKDVLAFLREESGEKMLVIINFSSQKQTVSLPIATGTVVCHSARNDEGKTISLSTVDLMGNDAYVIRIA